jgi:hypothetical protein
MSAPSEPEKYSVDEMMERLKNRPTEESIEDGELVIRADGSQAIRVRKRKRRSQQPHKERLKSNRRARMIQVSLALILVLTAVLGAGAAIVFANSAPFRSRFLQKISQSCGATADVDQFRMNPTSANATRLALHWPEGNALRDITLRNVKADISLSSFLGQSLTGEEVTSTDATMVLQVPRAGKPVSDTPATDQTPPIRFKCYATSKGEMIVGDPAAPLIRMQNSECSFYPVSANDRAQLLLNRGDIAITGWPKLRMDRSHIEFRGPDIDIVVMRLRHETDIRGVFELAGTVSPYAAGRVSTLAIRLEAYLLSGIVGPDLGRLLSGSLGNPSGRIDTLPETKSNFLNFTPGSDPQASLAITFHNSLTSSFELNGFPFLFGLSQALADNWFERPAFNSDVSGVLHRAAGNVSLTNLNFEDKGRMALRGTLTMTPSRDLSGNLEVGIADALIKTSKSPAMASLFGPPQDGFRWLTLTISGTTAAPKDNFRELFESAAKTTKSEPSTEIPTFEELTTPK